MLSKNVVAVAAALAILGCASQRASEQRAGVGVGADDARLIELARANIERKQAKLEANGPKPFDAPEEAARFFMAQRVAPEADYPMEQLRTSLVAVRARQAELERLRAPLPGGFSAWNALGPGNIGGRSRAIVVDPTNTDIMYAAGVAGGVWKSTDAGASWNATDDFMANLAVTTIAMDPTDTSVLYAGTGEGVANNSVFVRGLGIFRSIDAGASWIQIPTTNNANFHYVNKIKISPNDPTRLYAACRSGVWRSTDSGATWQVVLRNPSVIGGPQPSSNGCTVGCLDLDVRADRDPDVLFACFGNTVADGLFRSDDGGTTWLGYGVPANQGRMNLAMAPSNNDVMYLLMADNGSGGPWGSVVSVFRTADGGQTWTSQVDFGHQFGPLLLANMVLGVGCIQGGTYHQGWYDNVIAVDPIDPDVVWVGGVDIYRSDDGAQTFGIAGHWFYYMLDSPPPQYVHPDQHEIIFHPDYDGAGTQTMFVGNDGGLWKTDNGRAPTSQDGCPLEPPVDLPDIEWVSLNNGYGVTQFYHGDAARGLNRFIGGAQDNGTSMVSAADTPNAWDMVFGGDGGYCAIDPRDDDTIYLEYHEFPSIHKSTDGGQTFVEATTGITDTGGVFINPFAMDESNPDVLWTGAHRPFRTTNAAASWEVAGPNLPGAGSHTAFAVAPSDSNIVYTGYDNGYVARTTNALDSSPTWSQISSGLVLGGWVSSVSVDPFDPDIAYCTYSNFGVPHVWRTTNGGASWTSIDGTAPNNIPDLPVHWLAVRPCDSQQLYAATELGIFASDNGGTTWEPINTGLANTVVESLDWKRDDILVAFTHGRGAFVSYLSPKCNPCGGDVTTQGAGVGEPGYGEPDGQTTAADLNFFVNAWAAGGLVVADVTTQGASSGDPTYGVPDALVSASDLNYFVNAWVAGCP